MNTNKPIKIFVCGGHLSPAIATIDTIRRQHKPWEIVWIGRKFALENDLIRSQEYQQIEQRSVRFLPLFAGRFNRLLSFQTLLSLCKIPVGFFQALWYCMIEHPTLIVSFGGYIALPVVISGWICHIPAITHEQTSSPGLANRIIARFVQHICVVNTETHKAFSMKKIIVTGLPFREELFRIPRKSSFSLPDNMPILYVTGGSAGAATMNELVFPIVANIVKQYIVIHQTGELSSQEAVTTRSNLPPALRRRYIIQPFFHVGDISWILARAMLVIGRSGANTVYEIALFGKIALFIPLPWSAEHEQEINARKLQMNGSAMSFNQSSLTPQLLYHEIQQMIQKKVTYQRHAKQMQQTIIKDGASRIVAVIERSIGTHGTKTFG